MALIKMEELRLKTPDDIKRIREAGNIIAEIFDVISVMRFGDQTTWEIDVLIEDLIRKKKARPSFKTVRDYNYASCISINDEVVHGIPSRKKIIKKGDLVKIDIGVVKNGYFADRCMCFGVEPVAENANRLMRITGESLQRAIDIMIPDNRLGDIGYAIQEHVESNGFSVVRDLMGHGVGFAVHEYPAIPHFGNKGSGLRLKEGMVLAVEPMINEGSPDIISMDDGWTIATIDGKLSAQFEHTIAITKNGPEILTN